MKLDAKSRSEDSTCVMLYIEDEIKYMKYIATTFSFTQKQRRGHSSFCSHWGAFL